MSRSSKRTSPSREKRGGASGSRDGRGGTSGSGPLGLPGAWTPASVGTSRRADVLVERAAIALILVYGIYWGIRAFTVHLLGNYAVETDFYWKYGPAAAALKEGRVLIEHFDSKGWGYPLVVAGVSRLGLDLFRAGQIIALLSACVGSFCVFRIHRRLLGSALALLSLLLLLSNYTFLSSTYEVGTDMFFFAILTASIALLLGPAHPGWRAIAASGLLAGWAFTTRYNGLLLLPASVIALLRLLDPERPFGMRLRRAALWTAGFLVAAAPWLYVNWAHTGNPLTNSNYTNVGFAVFGEGNWERFFYGSDRKIHSLADVILLDPARFARVMLTNVVIHLKRNLTELMPLPWGIFTVAGLLLVALRWRTRLWGAYLLFGGLYFISLVPVFYGTRFGLPMIPFYASLAVAVFQWEKVASWVSGMERQFPVRIFVFLLSWVPGALSAYAFANDLRNPESIQAGPYETLEAAAYLREHARGETLLARKPHVAFVSGLRFAPIPQVDSPQALHETARQAHARYLLVSGAEVGLRAALRPFAEPDARIPGFRRVFESQGALVYEVLPDSSAAAPAPGAPSESPGGVAPAPRPRP